MVTREEVYDAWAPAGAVWSPWVKPVLFARPSPFSPPAEPLRELDMVWLPDASLRRTAIVVDLPGAQGVMAGLALARRGFRPVPLYTGLLGPFDPAHPQYGLATMVVDVLQIVIALQQAAPALAAIPLPDSAPPVFILDSDRRKGCVRAEIGMFNNRSVSFPTDFPSAKALRENGIEAALLLQSIAASPATDLQPTLLQWQQAGLPITTANLYDRRPPRDCPLTPPAWLTRIWRSMTLTFGLRPDPFGGGFGGVVSGRAAG